MMADGKFVVRLGLEGGQTVVRQLEDIGVKGDAALNRVATVARAETTPGFRAAAAAAGQVDTALQGLAARGGPVASVFASMGKSGLAAAAAIGAVSLGASLAARATLDSIQRIDQMGDAAERAGVSFEVFQELGFVLQKAGGEIEDVGGALNSFASKIGALRSGLRGGEQVEDALAILGISKESFLSLSSVEAQLALIADGIYGVGDAATQAKIAEQIGLEAFLPVLRLGAEGFARLTDEVRATGVVLSNDLGERAGEGVEAIEDATNRMNAAWDRLALEVSPYAIAVLDFLAELTRLANDAAEAIGNLAQAQSDYGFGGGSIGMGSIAGPAESDAQALMDLLAEWDRADEAARARLIQTVKARGLERSIFRTMLSADRPNVGGDQGGAPVRPRDWDNLIRAANRPRKGGRGDAAARASESFAERARARANWRDDPSAFGAMMQDQEEVSERVTASLLKQSTALEALRTAWVGVDGAQVAYRSGLDVLDSALRGQIRTLEDLGNVLVDILKQWIMMSAQMAAEGKGTFFGNLGSIFSSALSAFGIGGGSAAAPASTWSGFNWAFGRGRAGGGPAHAGQEFWVGEGGPEKVRFASPATIYSAQASLAMERQMRFAAPQAVLAAAPPRSALAAEPPRGPTQVVIQNNGPPVTAEAREDTQGGQSRLMLTLEPVVRQATDRNLSAGRHDRALQGRFGLPVAVQRR